MHEIGSVHPAILMLGSIDKTSYPSPSVALMELIQSNGGILSYSDPYIPYFKTMRNHDFDLQSVEVSKESLNSYDAVVLCTDHDNFDYRLIIENSKLVVDTRGVFNRGEFSAEEFKNLFSA